MICFCSCSGGPASNDQHLKYRAGSKVCKGCGGLLSIEGKRAVPGNMLSTVGLEISRIIDPNLSWKTWAKHRQRASRRARTSFGWSDRSIFNSKSSKAEDFTYSDTTKIGDMLVSESEKLGVSILGRRFSDIPESVPIKKRRVMLDCSAPCPPESPSHLCESDHTSYTESESNAVLKFDEIDFRARANSGQRRTGVFGKITLDVNNRSEDFSGISLLAAAACDSNIGVSLGIAEDSVPNGHVSEGDVSLRASVSVKSQTSSEVKGVSQFQTSDGAVGSILAFETSETENDASVKAENGVSSLENVLDKEKRAECPSRDDRLYWDLNIAMDAWVSNCDKSISEPAIGTASNEEKTRNEEACEDQMNLGEAKQPLDSRGHQADVMKHGIAVEVFDIQDKTVSSTDNSVVDYQGKELSVCRRDELVKEKNQITDEAISLSDAADQGNASYIPEKSCCLSVAASATCLLEVGSASAAQDSRVDAVCVSFGYATESVSLSGPDPKKISSIDEIVHSSRSPPPEDKSPSRLHYEGKISTTFSSVVDNFSAELNAIECGRKEAAKISGSDTENNASHVDDSGPSKTTCLMGNREAGRDSDMLVGDNMSNDMTTSCKPKYDVNFNRTTADCADKSRDTSQCLCDSHPITSHPSSNHDVLSSGSADMDVENNSCPMLAYGEVDASKAVCSVEIGSKLSGFYSANTSGIDSTLVPLSHQVVGGSYADSFMDYTRKVSLDDTFDLKCSSDASEIDAEHAVGMEKVDLLDDDDSPYEDGEFRESIVNSWVEGESELVDYEPDNRENDTVEAASSLLASVHMHADSLECKNQELSSTDVDGHQGVQFGSKFMWNPASQTHPTDASGADFSKKNVQQAAPLGALNIKDENRLPQRKVKDATESGGLRYEKKGRSKFLAEDDGSFFRTKSTGWDRLPDDYRSCGDELSNSGFTHAYQNHILDSAGSSKADESLRMVTSSSRKNLPLQIETMKPSSHIKDNNYLRTSRSSDHHSLKLKDELDVGDHGSVARAGSSLHANGRGRGDHWGDNHAYWGRSHHDSLGPSFNNSGSNNAAAAAVAKVESNGFVVAPDGTLVKAGGFGASVCSLRRSVNASSSSTCQTLGRRSLVDGDRAYGLCLSYRNSKGSPDRHFSSGRGRAHCYGPRIEGMDYGKSYRQVEDNVTSLSLHHPLSRRDRSFSPHGRSVNTSRSRSPSRSRTRSPHLWATSTGRSDNRLNAGHDSNLLARSQDFRSRGRVMRMKSSQCGSGFVDDIRHYSPIPKCRISPPHAPRWVNGRKNLCHLREHEYEQCSERSPRRFLSRRQRFDECGSPRSMKPDEYHQPAHSDRHEEYADAGRGSGRGGSCDDRSGNVVSYKNFRSARYYDSDGRMQQFHYNIDDSFRAHNPRPQISSKIEQSGNSREFDRRAENQHRDSPRIALDNRSHVRYGRDGKHNSSVK